MTNEKSKQCKSKGCYNPVLDGKYCARCKQKRKEKRDKILAGVGGAVVLGCGVAIKKGPKIAAKVIKVILKK
ncbi:hypothetical protein [Clostridium sp. YIM B02500]|uniref:hypothetical protein n=1 Tax=Clostridium sp. YIM B02500 TaxID=2910681 RepID=UPI001EEE9A5C|nr:hypothetical protein [Clostridium sp. YIM B02500]